MRLNAFSCGRGYILSAQCMFAPLDSEDECGQVSALIGPLDCEKLPADLCASIVRQIDDRLFAFVPTAVADASHLRELIDDIRREEN